MAKILIVDDSLVMRKNLRNILTQGGHEVVGESQNGKQAYIDYVKLKPDLVTMDITMPVMDGIESVKRIISIDKGARVIMISALAQKKMVFDALESGACNYILKPITAEKVLTTVDKVIRSNMAPIDKGKLGTLVSKESQFEEMHEKNEGFTMSNDGGVFWMCISSRFSMLDLEFLETAVNGLLFVKPLVITVEFETIPSDKELSRKLGNILDRITESSGSLTVFPHRFWEGL